MADSNKGQTDPILESSAMAAETVTDLEVDLSLLHEGGSDELFDELSSGSSFEILSVSEEVSETPRSNPGSEIASVLEDCTGENEARAEAYKEERTKLYVMESNFEFAEETDSDSGHFVKINRKAVQKEDLVEQCLSNESDLQPCSSTVIAEDEKQPDVSDQSENSQCLGPELDLMLLDNKGNETIPSSVEQSIKLLQPKLSTFSEQSTKFRTESIFILMTIFFYCFLLITFLLAFFSLNDNGYNSRVKLPRQEYDACFLQEHEKLQNDHCFEEVLYSIRRRNNSVPDCLNQTRAFQARQFWLMADRLEKTIQKQKVDLHEQRSKAHQLTSLVSELMAKNQMTEELLIRKESETSEQLKKVQEYERLASVLTAKEQNAVEKEDLKVQYLDPESTHNKPSSQDTTQDSHNLSIAFVHLMDAIEDMNHKAYHHYPTDPVFVAFLHYFIATNANYTGHDLSAKVVFFDGSLRAIGQCMNRLQSLFPSQTFYDIITLSWQQVEDIISSEAFSNDKTININKPVLGPCHAFMNLTSENRSAGNMKNTKGLFEGYINKTLDAVDKIGQTVRSTLESFITLPDKVLSKSKTVDSFSQRFKNSVEKMNKRFRLGFMKLKEKVGKKFKNSMNELNRRVKSGLEKINKQVSTAKAWFKNRNMKTGAKTNDVPNEPVPGTKNYAKNDNQIKRVEDDIRFEELRNVRCDLVEKKDTASAEQSAKSDSEFGKLRDKTRQDNEKEGTRKPFWGTYNKESEDCSGKPSSSKKDGVKSKDFPDSDWYFRRIGERECLLTDSNWYFAMMESRESSRHPSDWYFGNKQHSSFPASSKRYKNRARKTYQGR